MKIRVKTTPEARLAMVKCFVPTHVIDLIRGQVFTAAPDFSIRVPWNEKQIAEWHLPPDAFEEVKE